MTPPTPLQQPEGWRVKLYRLNQDGSWDDCGTGRILCIYENHQNSNNSNNNSNGNDNNSLRTEEPGDLCGTEAAKGLKPRDDSTNISSRSSSSNNNSNSSSNNNDNHLGYATLCVHSEVPVTAATSKNSPTMRQPPQPTESPKVLLRTRILLQETAYQRQGDNIITWYEPFYNANVSNNHHKDRMEQNGHVDGHDTMANSGGNGGGGVDLALSFQDNCGCLEIWEQIIAAQGRQVKDVVFAAAAAAQRHQQEQVQHDTGHHGDGRKISHRKMTKQQQQQQQQHGQKAGTMMEYDSSGCDTDANTVGTDVRSGDPTWEGMQHQHYHAANGTDGDISNRELEQQLYQTMSQHQFLMNDANGLDHFQLPSPPSIENIDDIADAIAALQQQHHLQQRELLSLCITANECLYYKQMLDIFYGAESQGNFAKLATLAACLKTMLLLNDPTILELTITDEAIFDRACACLEYDPDLREKANHRWFLRERVKFRTVVPMNDAELEQAIHRTFRVQYLRDTLLRPTMDESCLSTLSSLQTFTHADVIKGVTMASCELVHDNNNVSSSSDSANAASRELSDSYLVRVIRRLGIDLYTLQNIDWMELESPSSQKDDNMCTLAESTKKEITSDILSEDNDKNAPSQLPTIWKQHLAPQDDSVRSRRVRRRDALLFLRELFQMVRLSLQQCDRDDFFAVICTLKIDLFMGQLNTSVSNNQPTPSSKNAASVAGGVDHTNDALSPENDQNIFPQSANILSLLANVLLDADADMSEKGAALEILASVAMHDASLIRRHTLGCSRSWKEASHAARLPEANKRNQVLMIGPSDDVLSALIFLLNVETDAGVLLQVSEIMRIVLDTDSMNDQTLIYPTFADEADGIVPGLVHNPPHDQHNQPAGGGIGPTNSDQAQFLSVFYDYYAEWLVAPFQHTLAHPVRRVPDYVLRRPSCESTLMQSFLVKHKDSFRDNDPQLKQIAFCPVRLSFTIELLSFCVRAHLCRMKSFLLKSRVMGNVLQLLKRHPIGVPGDRCLKLAILRFLRAVVSVNDESYHRHIIQHNLFAYVFEAFRDNPVGDNLVSSAVVEMCDFINNENIKCLLDYIGRRHLIPKNSQTMSLEDVSSPYVCTISTLRKAYEANIEETQRLLETGQSSPGGSRYFPGGVRYMSSTTSSTRLLSGKALEDQRKFQEKDNEESYFDDDDDEGDERMNTDSNTAAIRASDDVELPQGKESDLHRTPRMFSLSETPIQVYHHFEEGEENETLSDTMNVV